MKYYICIYFGRIARLLKESLNHHIEGIHTKTANSSATIFCIGQAKLSMINVNSLLTKHDIQKEAEWVGDKADFVVVGTPETLKEAEAIKPDFMRWKTRVIDDDVTNLYYSFNQNPNNKIHPQIAMIFDQQGTGTQINPEYIFLHHPQACLFENIDILRQSLLPTEKQQKSRTKLIFNGKNWLPVAPDELSTDFLTEIENRFNYNGTSIQEITASLFTVLKGKNTQGKTLAEITLADYCNRLAQYIETAICVRNHPGKFLTFTETKILYLRNLAAFIFHNLRPPETAIDREFQTNLLTLIDQPDVMVMDTNKLLAENIHTLSTHYGTALRVIMKNLQEHYKCRLNWLEHQLHLEKLIEHVKLLVQESTYYLDEAKYTTNEEHERLAVVLATLKVALNDSIVAVCANHAGLLTIYSKLGNCLYLNNEFSAALFYYKEEFSLLLTYHSNNHARLAANYHYQGMCLVMLDDPRRAHPLLLKALDLRKTHDKSNKEGIKNILTTLKICELKLQEDKNLTEPKNTLKP